MAVIQAVAEEISSTQIADNDSSRSRGEQPTQTALYALITHPGHHAGFSNCSGYCYINSAAVLAQLIRKNNVI
jgi:acetoin utilization deacetylase AcuC-like enzyme